MAADQIYQLRVVLDEIAPPIWRRLLVPGSIDLPRLHRVFQAVMGWTNSHMHLFEVGAMRFLEPDPDDGLEPGERSERGVRLSEIAPSDQAHFRYDYDMGDGWEHTVVVEKIMPVDPATKYPVCLEGQRACPPEDCGGVPGYFGLLEILKDRDHPEYEEMVEWLERPYDPERFDVAAVNRALVKLAIPVAGAIAKPARVTKARASTHETVTEGYRYTERQGQYLAFIYYYTLIAGVPPAEADMAAFFRVTGPSAHMMVVTLEERGFISRVPGQGRSIRLLLPRSELPDLEPPETRKR